MNKGLAGLLLACACFATPAWATTTVLLDANFNDKPLNTQIGSGGPSAGEPIFISSEMDAKVQATPLPSRSLHLNRQAGTSGGPFIHFEFVDSAEPLTGDVRVAFTVRSPATTSSLDMGIRAQGSNTAVFGGLTFRTDGDVESNDATGRLSAIYSFTPSETMDVEYIYHMEARTYDLRINNVLLLDNRTHGIVDLAAGIGRLRFATTASNPWVIDDIAVTHTTPNTLLLDANFNDKPLDVQVGTGGATVGEPISFFPGLSAIVRAAPLGTPSLHFSHAGGVSRAARFELLDAEEVKRGWLRTAFTVRTPAVLDAFQVRLLDPLSNARRYGGVDFTAGGVMQTNDRVTGNETIASYTPNQTLRFEFVHQLVAGTYDLYINDALVLDDRPYFPVSADRGIGIISVGLLGSSSQEWVFDDLRVERGTALLDANFNNQPLNQQIGTGGPGAGQPVSLGSPDLVAEVRDGLFPTPALALQLEATGFTRAARFELPGSVEITRGELRFSLRVLSPTVASRFNVYLREQGGSAQSFGSLEFRSNGSIRMGDESGSLAIGTYTPGVEQLLEFRYYMDSGTYDVYIDRVPALLNRSWGMTTPGRGIGAVLVSTYYESTEQWVVDDLYVYQPDDVLFKNGFD